MVVILDGSSLALEDAASVAEDGERVRLEAASVRRMKKFRRLLEDKLNGGSVIYGVNTGFGSLSDKPVAGAKLRELQLNLIRSHAAGVGEPFPKEVVRLAMVLRLNNLAKGNSAVRASVAALIMGMLNADVTPYVPRFGSLGASGDLAPSAHVALAMVGEGKSYYEDNLLDSGDALSRANLEPLRLEAKEGLSLVNGTCFSTALACMAIGSGRALLKAANRCVAITGEAVGACAQSFDERLVGLKLSPGQAFVANEIRENLKGSRRVRNEPVPQDPYSIRCAPQVHGSLKDALDFAADIASREINSVSDNPVLTEDGTVLHGGNFHAQPVAMASDLLSFAVSYVGIMSLARIHLLLSRSPAERKYMAHEPGLNSGLMILEYIASSLAAENAKQAYPLSNYPANVSEGVEDHASYGVNSGLKALSVAENVSRILAIEMICASNFLGVNVKGTSPSSKRLFEAVRNLSPLLRGDRSLAGEIELLSREVLAGKLH